MQENIRYLLSKGKVPQNIKFNSFKDLSIGDIICGPTAKRARLHGKYTQHHLYYNKHGSPVRSHTEWITIEELDVIPKPFQLCNRQLLTNIVPVIHEEKYFTMCSNELEAGNIVLNPQDGLLYEYLGLFHPLGERYRDIIYNQTTPQIYVDKFILADN